MRNILFAVFLPLMVVDFAHGQAVRPVDEGPERSDFAAFRSELLAAARQQDTAAVLDVLAEDVLASFGSNAGVEGFRRHWFGGESTGESLFDVLEEVVAGGGEFLSDSMFAAPYTYTAFPDALDAFEHAVVIGSNVRVRSRPGLSAEVVGSRTHEVVRAPDLYDTTPADGIDWVEIRLDDGSAGWIARRYLRSPLGYRVVFVLRDGRWQLRSLVAGD